MSRIKTWNEAVTEITLANYYGPFTKGCLILQAA